MSKTVGGILVVLGVFAGSVAFWAPAVDPNFGMGKVPAWEWTDDRFVRHVVPALAVVVGGVLLFAQSLLARVAGSLIAVVGAVWIVIAPIVLGTLAQDGTFAPTADIARKLAHHFGTGSLIIAVAAFALGWVLAVRKRPSPGRTDAPTRDRETVST